MTGLERCPYFLDGSWLEGLTGPGTPLDGRSGFRRFVQAVAGDAVPLSREAILGDDEFVSRFRPYRERAGREIPRATGHRALTAIFDGAVTRARRDAAVMTAVRERYTIADIARFLEVHPSTVSKIVATWGQTVKKPSIQDLTLP